MKKSIVFFLSCYALFACTDSVDLSAVNKEIANYNGMNIGGNGLGPVGQYTWTRLPYQYLGEFEYYEDNFPFVVDGSAYCLAGYGQYLPFKLNNRTKRWESFESDCDFSSLSDRYLFSYGSKIYYAYDELINGQLVDYIGAFDMNTKIEQEKASFPMAFPHGYISFVIGNKGYLMGGGTYSYVPTFHEVPPSNQIWEYDFVLDRWTNKGNMPGGARAFGQGFVVGNKVYFGLGYDFLNMNGQNIKRYKKDWYSFDPASGTYGAILADFPGTLELWPTGFSLNEKIYIGYEGCYDDDGGCGTLWEYNIPSGKWSKKSVPQYSQATSFNPQTNFFSLGNAGYMVIGSIDEFWRYSTSSLVPTNP